MGRSSGNQNGIKTYGTGIGYDQRITSKYREGQIDFINFLDLYNLAIGRFEWYNLEDCPYLSTRVLEESLIWEGSCLFFNNYDLGIVALPSSNSGKFDINNIPKTRRVSRPNGYKANRTNKDSVLCFNDDTRMSFIPVIDYYTRKMTEIDRTIEQNLKLQRKPKILVVNQNNQNSVKKMLESNAEYTYPYLLVDQNVIVGGDLSKEAYALDLSVPFIADKLRIEKDMLRSEYLTRLGINNTKYEKKERLTNDEINVNNGEINSYRYTALKCRREACKKVNEMFGTNIAVRYAIETGGSVNGTLYADSETDNISGNSESESAY